MVILRKSNLGKFDEIITYMDTLNRYPDYTILGINWETTVRYILANDSRWIHT